MTPGPSGKVQPNLGSLGILALGSCFHSDSGHQGAVRLLPGTAGFRLGLAPGRLPAGPPAGRCEWPGARGGARFPQPSVRRGSLRSPCWGPGQVLGRRICPLSRTRALPSRSSPRPGAAPRAPTPAPSPGLPRRCPLRASPSCAVQAGQLPGVPAEEEAGKAPGPAARAQGESGALSPRAGAWERDAAEIALM